MQESRKAIQSHPLFPALLALPLKTIPAFVYNKMLVTILNRVFVNELHNGELDFLQDKIVRITVDDAAIEFQFSLQKDELITVNASRNADLFLNGTVYDYLLLASRSEDADTLFFNRQLHMQGDTELGLYVKNLLDGMDIESHKIFSCFDSLLKKSLPVYQRLFG